MAEKTPFAKCYVTVQNAVSKFIAEGGDVFAVHVVKVDVEVCARDEVIVLDEDRHVLAVGRAVLSSEEITAFKTGVAVKDKTWYQGKLSISSSNTEYLDEVNFMHKRMNPESKNV